MITLMEIKDRVNGDSLECTEPPSSPVNFNTSKLSRRVEKGRSAFDSSQDSQDPRVPPRRDSGSRKSRWSGNGRANGSETIFC